MDYEQWTRGEIARMREQGNRLLAESDGMEKALSKWLESQRGDTPRAAPAGTNGHAKRGGRKKAGYGSKTGFVMEKIDDSREIGVTTDQIFQATEAASMNMKRSSLRSILWHAKNDGQIDLRNGRYFPIQKGPNA